MLYDSNYILFMSLLCVAGVTYKILTMAISANKKFWTEFIDIYHSLPSLWNTKDESYNNRESRSFAWNKLVKKLQEVEPDANQDSVKRKINTFRSNFNREVRKIRQTQKDLPNEVYNPTLWYFDQLSFLLNQVKCNNNDVSIDGHYDEEITLMTLTTAKEEIIENEIMNAESNSQEHMTENKLMLGVKKNSRDSVAEPKQLLNGPTPFIEIPPKKPMPQVRGFTRIPQGSTSPECHINHIGNREKPLESRNVSTSRALRLKRSKLRLKSQNPHRSHQFYNNLPSSIFTDESTIYGQAWACGFRKLSPQQKIFAKKAIDEILILGQLKALKLNTVPINENFLEEQ